ncbi:histone lysine demethylase JmjC NO66 [Toxoplasma gondii VAND]|uniref:Bifunctional lysine-specific demethylase and histidyl-hydroxylase n=1 Tax=Toxoplasma gondii VAND TaxID=933077 RepID=A0A086PVM6_TOXGO|nr:histone lysine demethylase JmjC NO66 [Toxoplasma gondii VAND]
MLGKREAFPDDPGKPLLEFVLKEGDILYIPRGFPHAAVTTEEPSLHITLTVPTAEFAYVTCLQRLVKSLVLTHTLPSDTERRCRSALLLKDVPGAAEDLHALRAAVDACAEQVASRLNYDALCNSLSSQLETYEVCEGTEREGRRTSTQRKRYRRREKRTRTGDSQRQLCFSYPAASKPRRRPPAPRLSWCTRACFVFLPLLQSFLRQRANIPRFAAEEESKAEPPSDSFFPFGSAVVSFGRLSPTPAPEVLQSTQGIATVASSRCDWNGSAFPPAESTPCRGASSFVFRPYPFRRLSQRHRWWRLPQA